MEYLLEMFGAIPLSTVIILIGALAFIGAMFRKVYKFLIQNHDEWQAKDELLNRIAMNVEALKESQDSMKVEIERLSSEQKKMSERQELIEEEAKERKKNELRDRLLQLYRFYTDKKGNPLQAWTEMEEDAFRQMFKDYEGLGGNGFMHTTVEPAINSLKVVSMFDSAGIDALNQSRLG